MKIAGQFCYGTKVAVYSLFIGGVISLCKRIFEMVASNTPLSSTVLSLGKETCLSCADTLTPNLKNIKLAYRLVAIVACFGGVAIYAFFRNIDNIVLFQYFPKPAFLASLGVPLNTGTVWGYLFVFNLPHGLWCLSGLLVIRSIWLTNIKWRAIYAGIFLAVISALEISQLSEIRHGTFDMLDLAAYGVFAFMESITYNKFIRRKVL